MKTVLFAAAAAMTLIAGPALAQVAPNNPTDRQAPSLPPGAASQVPTFQQGSNQQAGGPANELNSPTGGVPVTNAPSQVPSFQQGSNQRAGGPANELNSTTGGGLPVTNAPSQVPTFQQGSNQKAGGPANELNSPTGVPGTTGTIRP